MKKKALLNYRQGEILILGYNQPFYQQTKDLPHNVIAEGETSGHKHEVQNGKLVTSANGQMHLFADKGCKVTHQEHKSVSVPKGKYDVRVQKEYNEEKDSTKVKD